LSSFRLALNPYVTFNAPQLRGFLATEQPAFTLVNPGFTRELRYSGAGLSVGLDAKLGINTFAPFSISAGVDFGYSKAISSATNLSFPNGLGITSVGVTPGVYISSPTDIQTFDFTSDRGYAALSKQLGIPLFSGSLQVSDAMPMLDYEISGLVGTRLGYLNQRETTRIVSYTPAFGLNGASSINYDTDFRGTFFGANVGLGLDKKMALPANGTSLEPLTVSERLSLVLGYDAYRIDVTDSVNATGLGGALNHVSTNNLSYATGVMTAKLDASLGIGTKTWMAYIGGGISTGFNPYIDYAHPDSVGGIAAPPTLTLVPGVQYEANAGFTFRF
ncbi:MAG: hypothetical protein ACYC0C_17870, partial [Devosia sp.]